MILMVTFCNLYGQDEFQIIQSKINNHLKAQANNEDITQSIAKDLPLQLKNGSWAAIDYSSKIETAWPPLLHLKRMSNLALGFAIKENNYHDNQEVLTGIISGLRYW